MIFDPLYLMMVLPAVILGFWAQTAVKGRFEKYSRVPNSRGITGAEAATQMMRAAGITDVKLERSEGMLSDHYDPRSKTVRLSPAVYEGRSVASLAVACHEVGHVYQHVQHYGPLKLRSALVPLSFGANFGVIILFIGLMLSSFKLAVVGLALFSVIVAFQLINLPVEFNASARAKEYLLNSGLASPGAEAAGVGKVLNAAALTYVAATAQVVMQLLYFALIVFGGRRD